MGLRFNPPPGWPRPPEGFEPPPGWQPDPSWPPPPPGWQLWVPDDSVQDAPSAGWPTAAQPGGGSSFPGQPGGGSSYPGQPGGGSSFPGQPGGGSSYPGQPGGGSSYPGQPGGGGSFPGQPGPGGYPPYPGQPGYDTPVPGQFPGQPGYAAPYPGQPGRKRTNGFAIASLIFGIIGGVLLSVIFGIVALAKIRSNPQQGGKGLAIAGLVLSGLWCLLIVLVIVGNALSVPQRSSTGQVTTQGTESVFSLRAGDCFQNPAGTHVNSVHVIPCTQPHNAQVYAQFPATGGDSYPGVAALRLQAKHGCNARVASNVNRSLVTDSMTIQFLYPESDAWANGERTIRCLIVDSSADLTTSLMSSG